MPAGVQPEDFVLDENNPITPTLSKIDKAWLDRETTLVMQAAKENKEDDENQSPETPRAHFDCNTVKYDTLHQIESAKNLREIKAAWQRADKKGFLGPNHHKEYGRKIFLALIQAAFRCDLSIRKESCFSYYQQARQNNMTSVAIHRLMFRISASCQNIKELKSFYSLLEKSGHVEPMDYLLRIQSLFKEGKFLKGFAIYYNATGLPANLSVDDLTPGADNIHLYLLKVILSQAPLHQDIGRANFCLNVATKAYLALENSSSNADKFHSFRLISRIFEAFKHCEKPEININFYHGEKKPFPKSKPNQQSLQYSNRLFGQTMQKVPALRIPDFFNQHAKKGKNTSRNPLLNPNTKILPNARR